MSTRAGTNHVTERVTDATFLSLTENVGVEDVERCHDPRERAVRVLSPGSTRRRHAQDNLFGGNRETASKGERSVVIDVRVRGQSLGAFGKAHHGDLLG